MNISNYDFHDGCLIKLTHLDNKIEIIMESAEIADEELQDEIVLSKNETIIGKLHLDGIKNIKINDVPFPGFLMQDYDCGMIYSFEIQGDEIILVVGWENRPPKTYHQTDFQIKADAIYWENIPDFSNPFR